MNKPIPFADHFPGADPLKILGMLADMPGSGVYRNRRPKPLLSAGHPINRNKAKAARKARKKNKKGRK